MSPENKQRVIGVVVLLAFIALLIPFLFTSGIRKKQSLSDEIPINAEKREQIAEQIQGMDNTTANVNVTEPTTSSETPPSSTLTTQNQLGPSTTELPTNNQIGSMGNVEANQQDQSAPIPTDTVTTNEQEAMPEISATPAESTAVKPMIKAIKKPVKKIKHAKMLKGFWSVQVGSFSNQVRVQKLITELHQKGFRVYTQNIATAGGPLTRVLVGRETSKEKAMKLAKRLESSMKIKGQIVRKK